MDNSYKAKHVSLQHSYSELIDTVVILFQAVVLNRCNLSQVKSTTFTPLTGSLSELYLTHNMQPLDLPDGLFTGLKLKTLSLVRFHRLSNTLII